MHKPSLPTVTLIAALARNRVIGANNQLLWHLPQDMAHFRRQTQGAVVIMGRKTWESLPPRFRPLPGRINIVLSRAPAYEATGAHVVAGWDAALGRAQSLAPGVAVFVIGGEQVYRLALPQAQRMVLTEIDHDFVGDAHFPTWPPGEFTELSREPHAATEPPWLSFSFVTYQRQIDRS